MVSTVGHMLGAWEPMIEHLSKTVFHRRVQVNNSLPFPKLV